MGDDTKEHLVGLIKEWLRLDKELQSHRKLARQCGSDQKTVSAELISLMKSNEIDVFNTNDVSFRYVRRKTKQTISKAYLAETLNKYFNDTEKASEIGDYIEANRQEKTVDKLHTKRSS